VEEPVDPVQRLRWRVEELQRSLLWANERLRAVALELAEVLGEVEEAAAELGRLDESRPASSSLATVRPVEGVPARVDPRLPAVSIGDTQIHRVLATEQALNEGDWRLRRKAEGGGDA
jgi:hypothetical protein